ncbi:MAG: YeeE/YedE family protein [Candidatus Electrothrix sp. AR4]|nr:YeeE/YedE family protein [Candidatus Electrothrix sp. AR4]
MSDASFLGKMRGLYKELCETEWNANITGVIIAVLSILIMVWWRPWGAVGAIRNWGDWILHGVGLGDAPKSALISSGSVIGIGFVAGAFLSACLGGQFALRFPPYRELVKGIIAGILMGVGSALAGGCNVGGMYNAIGNLAANGFSMWLGLVLGVLLGLWLLYKEMEYITWGSAGAWTVQFPRFLQTLLGIAALAGLIYGAYQYSGYDPESDDVDYIASLSGILLLASGLGYAMHRGRWCMIQGFREPHMTGDCTLAKSVALSIFILAVGGAVVKYAVPISLDGESVLDPSAYVRGTFGWGGVVGGFIFGLGGMLAGGCGSGTLWRVGEGQIKLWLVVPFFGIANSLMTKWFRAYDFEGMKAWRGEGVSDGGVLGRFIYLPEVMGGFGPTLGMIALIMALWYVIVTWNEESNKLIVPM